MLIKYIKSVLWREAKRLSYIEDAWCLKVNILMLNSLCLLRVSKPRFHLQEDCCIYRYSIVRFTCISTDSLVGGKVCSIFSYFQVQPTRCNVTQFNYFLWKAVHVSGGSSSHHQELKTVYRASGTLYRVTQKKRELLKNPTKIEEIKNKIIDRNWTITTCLLRDRQECIRGGGRHLQDVIFKHW